MEDGEFGLGKTKTVEIFEDFVQFAAKNDVQIIAVAGKNEKMKLAFEEVVHKNSSENIIKVLEFTDKVPELMYVSNVVVTKPGGMTTTESLASELPMVIINPIPGQEEENAEFLESKGIGIWIKKDTNMTEILHTLFSNPERLERMKRNTKLLAKPNSTKDICHIVLG